MGIRVRWMGFTMVVAALLTGCSNGGSSVDAAGVPEPAGQVIGEEVGVEPREVDTPEPRPESRSVSSTCSGSNGGSAILERSG